MVYVLPVVDMDICIGRGDSYPGHVLLCECVYMWYIYVLVCACECRFLVYTASGGQRSVWGIFLQLVPPCVVDVGKIKCHVTAKRW